MCESVVCGLHYGLHSIFKHTNELYYCNCTEFLNLLFGTANLSSSVH